MVTKKLCLVLLMICLVLVHVEGNLNEPNVQVSGKTENFCVWFGSKSINALITYIYSFNVYCFTSRSRIFFLHRNATITDEMLVSLDLCSIHCRDIAFHLYRENNFSTAKGTITKFKFGLHCHFKYYLEFESVANSLVLCLSLV